MRAIPPIVHRAAKLAFGDTPVPRQVRIVQEGEMWTKPGGRPLRFTATQVFDVTLPAFSWKARFPLLGPLSLSVVDELRGGRGGLDVRLLGVPLQRQRGPETTVGEALRYLAELPWVPFALLHNDAIRWREVDSRTAEASLETGAGRAAVSIRFADGGEIVRVTSSRPRKVAGEWVPTRWGGAFGSYEALGGIRVPTSAEAHWDLPDGRFRYWRGTVISAELLQGLSEQNGPP